MVFKKEWVNLHKKPRWNSLIQISSTVFFARPLKIVESKNQMTFFFRRMSTPSSGFAKYISNGWQEPSNFHPGDKCCATILRIPTLSIRVLFVTLVEWMTEYQQAARMLARQPWKLPLRLRHKWNISISWKGEMFYDEIIWWWYCNIVWNGFSLLLGIKVIPSEYWRISYTM